LADDNAGNNIAARMAITAITTSNSTKVNAFERATCDLIPISLQTFLDRRHPLPEGQGLVLLPDLACPSALPLSAPTGLPRLAFIPVLSTSMQVRTDFFQCIQKQGPVQAATPRVVQFIHKQRQNNCFRVCC
jgi:hypothetical protein